jgi:hypothetical protein
MAVRVRFFAEQLAILIFAQAGQAANVRSGEFGLAGNKHALLLDAPPVPLDTGI